jgi:hypothetical protein
MMFQRTTCPHVSIRVCLGFVAAVFLSVSSVASAGEGKTLSFPNVTVISIPGECPADDNPPMTAMKAFIDPQTGELRPGTPEEEAELARVISGQRGLRTEATREAMVREDGSVILELGEDSMEDLVVRVLPDGKPVFLCVPRPETVKAFTRPVSSLKATPEVK